MLCVRGRFPLTASLGGAAARRAGFALRRVGRRYRHTRCSPRRSVVGIVIAVVFLVITMLDVLRISARPYSRSFRVHPDNKRLAGLPLVKGV